MQNKQIGKEAEQLVADYFVNLGYLLIDQNYTIRGGEIDLIVERWNIRTFIEVKCVNHTEDLINYVTPKKIETIKKTIQHYNHKHPSTKNISLDLVFVKGNTIIQHCSNITNN